jgi:hypothetical protein
MIHQARRISRIAFLLDCYSCCRIHYSSLASSAHVIRSIFPLHHPCTAMHFLCYRLAYVFPRSVKLPSFAKKLAHSLPSSKAPVASIRQFKLCSVSSLV